MPPKKEKEQPMAESTSDMSNLLQYLIRKDEDRKKEEAERRKEETAMRQQELAAF